MNKTIKEQAQGYINSWDVNIPLSNFIEHIITEERKRRLPSRDEFNKACAESYNKKTICIEQAIMNVYDWLLSYEREDDEDFFPMGNCNDCGHKVCMCKTGDHIGEVNEKVGEDYQAKYNEALGNIIEAQNEADFWKGKHNDALK